MIKTQFLLRPKVEVHLMKALNNKKSGISAPQYG
jgi:hypothetical protein